MTPIQESMLSLTENQIALLLVLVDKGLITQSDIDRQLPVARHLVEQMAAKKREEFRVQNPGVLELMEIFW